MLYHFDVCVLDRIHPRGTSPVAALLERGRELYRDLSWSLGEVSGALWLV